MKGGAVTRAQRCPGATDRRPCLATRACEARVAHVARKALAPSLDGERRGPDHERPELDEPEDGAPPATRTDRPEHTRGVLDEHDVTAEALGFGRRRERRTRDLGRCMRRGRLVHRQHDRRHVDRLIRAQGGIEVTEPEVRQRDRARDARDHHLLEYLLARLDRRLVRHLDRVDAQAVVGRDRGCLDGVERPVATDRRRERDRVAERHLERRGLHLELKVADRTGEVGRLPGVGQRQHGQRQRVGLHLRRAALVPEEAAEERVRRARPHE